MITIIDYGLGNILAFVNVYKRLNIPVTVAKTAAELVGATKLILPGVGAFALGDLAARILARLAACLARSPTGTCVVDDTDGTQHACYCGRCCYTDNTQRHG